MIQQRAGVTQEFPVLIRGYSSLLLLMVECLDPIAYGVAAASLNLPRKIQPGQFLRYFEDPYLVEMQDRKQKGEIISNALLQRRRLVLG